MSNQYDVIGTLNHKTSLFRHANDVVRKKNEFGFIIRFLKVIFDGKYMYSTSE